MPPVIESSKHGNRILMIIIKCISHMILRNIGNELLIPTMM